MKVQQNRLRILQWIDFCLISILTISMLLCCYQVFSVHPCKDSGNALYLQDAHVAVTTILWLENTVFLLSPTQYIEYGRVCVVMCVAKFLMMLPY